MKKAFISVPMHDRTDDEVFKDLQDVKEAHKGEFDSFVDNYSTPVPDSVKNPSLYLLGKALQKMSFCDDVLFGEGWDQARGCLVEWIAHELYQCHNDLTLDALMSLAHTQSNTAIRKNMPDNIEDYMYDNEKEAIHALVEIKTKLFLDRKMTVHDVFNLAGFPEYSYDLNGKYGWDEDDIPNMFKTWKVFHTKIGETDMCYIRPGTQPHELGAK